MVTSTNNSDIKFGLHDNAERYCWVLYFLIGCLSSLIGDTLILIASCREGAFKVNKLIVIILQHIAVSDLACTVSATLPTAVSLLANSWVLGDALCFAGFYMRILAYPAGIALIALLTSSKFLLLRYPLRAGSFAPKNVRLVCCFIWVFSLIHPILFLSVDKDDVHFSYTVYNCVYGFNEDVWGGELKFLKAAVSLICFFVPVLVIVTTTIPTLKFLSGAKKSAKRVQGCVPRQGALTVVLTAAAFCISTLPATVYFIVDSLVKEELPAMFHIRFHRIAHFLMMINVMSNFYIYTLTIRSFRTFVFSKFMTIVPSSSHIMQTMPSSAGKTQIYFFAFDRLYADGMMIN